MDCSKFVNFGKKIVGIGLNYKSLLLERNLPIPKTPIVFLKPTSSYITAGKDIESSSTSAKTMDRENVVLKSDDEYYDEFGPRQHHLIYNEASSQESDDSSTETIFSESPGESPSWSDTSVDDNEIPKGFKVNEEVELGVIIGQKCKKVSAEKALDYVAGYCIALDLTETVQLVDVRKNGHPWTFVKGFDTACPVSQFIPMEKVPNPHDVQLWCKVDGKIVQDGNTSEMIFNIPEIISHISRCMTLEPGDLIITGSPTGVSLIEPGSLVEAGSKSLGIEMQFKVKSDD